MCKIVQLVIIMLISCFWAERADAQNVSLDETIAADSVSADIQVLSEFEILMTTMSDLMHKAEASTEITEKEELSGIFKTLLFEELKKEGSFDLSFDTIPHVAQLVSNDGLVRIFSWVIPTQKRGIFNYHCIIQHRMNKATKISDVFVLEDTKNRIVLPEHEILKYPNWYGCLYYQMVEKIDGKNVYYTLIGHDFNDGITNKKCVDVLTFDKYANPVFGASIFLLGKKPQCRALFEYSAQSTMKLAYFNDIDKIVYNYLHPITKEKENDRRYYVPDISYEGLMFKLGKWIKVPNVEMIIK